jgi:hypothetical protein
LPPLLPFPLPPLLPLLVPFEELFEPPPQLTVQGT